GKQERGAGLSRPSHLVLLQTAKARRFRPALRKSPDSPPPAGSEESGPNISACACVPQAAAARPHLGTAYDPRSCPTPCEESPLTRAKTPGSHAFTCHPHCPAWGRSGSPLAGHLSGTVTIPKGSDIPTRSDAS